MKIIDVSEHWGMLRRGCAKNLMVEELGKLQTILCEVVADKKITGPVEKRLEEALEELVSLSKILKE